MQSRGLIAITDQNVAKLTFAKHATYMVRDNRLPAFRVQIGKTVKSFRFESEFRRKGKRIRVSRWLGNHPEVKAHEARRQCHVIIGEIGKGTVTPGRRQALSLELAMQKHTNALEAKARGEGRKPTWAAETRRLYARHMKQWARRSIVDLSNNPEEVARWHARIAEECGPSEAAHAARALNACYRRMTELTRGLPAQSPTSAVKASVSHEREAREFKGDDNGSIPLKALPLWAAQVCGVEREWPLRACFHRLNLFTGMRPGELARMKWSGVSCKDRTLTVERGKTRPITIPMSRLIAAELKRARAAQPKGYEGPYVFPSTKSESGHLENWLADKLDWRGHACRRAHATVAATLNDIDPFVARMLASHSTRDTHELYINRAELLRTRLRAAQRMVSREIERLIGEGRGIKNTG